MAETLGSLLDKLSVLKIRQWHTDEMPVYRALDDQVFDLQEEIDTFVHGAIAGEIPHHKLTQPAFKTGGRNGAPIVIREIGSLFSELADVNSDLWHEVDKSHRPTDELPPEEWAKIVKRLAALNHERNDYKEAIDEVFSDLCKS
jgi:Protein of unknown function (DUF4254)